jgi:hypothetical protein
MKIVIAYHAYLYGSGYMAMITEQFRLFIHSGLFNAADKVYIGIVDCPNKKPENGIEWVNHFWKFASSKEAEQLSSKVEIVVYPRNKELIDTLKWIRDYSKQNPDDYILFFHTKGITHYTPATEDWRRYMEYFTIENWRDCIAKLDEGYDCCGVLWNKDTPIGDFPHFSGAFYWAKASYINTLNHDYLDSLWRFHMEFWIGSNPNAKVFEFHNSRLNDKDSLIAAKGHYNVEYPRSNYEKR